MFELRKIQEKFEMNQVTYYAASYISPFIVLTYLEAVDVTFLGWPLLLSANARVGCLHQSQPGLARSCPIRDRCGDLPGCISSARITLALSSPRAGQTNLITVDYMSHPKTRKIYSHFFI